MSSKHVAASHYKVAECECSDCEAERRKQTERDLRKQQVNEWAAQARGIFRR